ncbi:MAG: bifunctional pantoate--beta-alanine ligase/(d)CMP kinase [Pseudanabaenaceae cyanobacterium]
MTRIFRRVAALRCWRRSLVGDVGFVPTMGALHRGHGSLMERARRENRYVIVSIFVNPMQFGPQEDFHRYPRTWEADVQLCQSLGVDAIFAPLPAEVVPSFRVVPPPEMVQVLCGPHRPGHFEGVCTIVLQLLNIVQPDRVYLGQKDGQQVAIVARMVEEFHLPVQVVRCPTVREASGLALSSRNRYLQGEEQRVATLLYQALALAVKEFEGGERSVGNLIKSMENFLRPYPQLRLQYIECVDLETLTPLDVIMDGMTAMLAIAGYVGNTRLIDNVLLQKRRPIVAIDGPAGAGKSTVAKLVAEKLGLVYLDTGAMYRAITWSVLQAGIDLEDKSAIVELASNLNLRVTSDAQIFVNGENVTQVIRQQAVTAAVSTVAAIPEVRAILVKEQQALGKAGGVVMEGRDIGTHVFPQAEVKIFLTASVAERARRRQRDLQQRQLEVPDLAEIQKSIEERDYKDMHRPISPLRQAEDAIRIDTDGMTIEEVVDKIISLWQERL